MSGPTQAASELRKDLPRAPARAFGTKRRRNALTGGGSDGNEQLTATTGLILIVLLAVLGVTILRIHQLISVHLFVGLLLLGPVTLKMGSTGYRFLRYYTHDPVYRRKGPPEPLLRVIAPVVVLSTVVVFASGIALLFEGPSGQGPLLMLHKASFAIWILVTALHVLGHLPRLTTSARAVSGANRSLSGGEPGAAGRWITLVGALVGALVLAVALIPQFAAWTQAGAFSGL